MKSYSFYFNASDWLASPAVKQMSLAERGAYIGLLAFSWGSEQPGTLPASADKVRRLAEMSAAEWAESGEALLEKFPLSACGTHRYNPRLLAEAGKEQLRSQKAKESADKRWESKRNANAPKNDANASETACETDAIVKVSKESTNVDKKASMQRAAVLTASADSPSPAEKPAPATGPAGGRPVQYRCDEAPVFLAKGFFAHLAALGYGHVDQAMYLLRISQGAQKAVEKRKISELASNEQWQEYIQRWLDNDKRNGQLLLPDGAPRADGRTAVLVTLATPERMSSSLPARVKAQEAKIWL